MNSNISAQIEQLNKDSNAKWAEYQALLPQTDDVSLIVLKGHLIIEEMLYDLVEVYCVSKPALEKAKLTFSQLLHLACAIVKPQLMDTCSLAIGQLNTIRNSLVHNLKPKQIEMRLLELQRMCKAVESELPAGYKIPTEPPRIAESAICFIIGQLHVIKIVAALVSANPQVLIEQQKSQK